MVRSVQASTLSHVACAGPILSIVCGMCRALCTLGQLEAATDALHHLLQLISYSHSPPTQQAHPHEPSLLHDSAATNQLGSHTAAAQQPETFSQSHAAIHGFGLPQSQEFDQARPHAQLPLAEDISAAVPADGPDQQASTQGTTSPLLQHQPLTSDSSQASHPTPAQPPTSDQQIAHELMYSQHMPGQQVGSQSLVHEQLLTHRAEAMTHLNQNPVKPGQQAEGQQGRLMHQALDRRGHRHRPHDWLMLVQMACHSVMILAEQRGRPELMLPLLESMQQVCNGPQVCIAMLHLCRSSSIDASPVARMRLFIPCSCL